MRYLTLQNFPNERRRITFPYVIWGKTFEANELQRVTETCESFDLLNGSIVGESDQSKTETIRKSKVSFIKRSQSGPDEWVYDEKVAWIFNRFNEAIRIVNEKYYNFDLNGYEQLQYTVYDGEEEGKYDWHMDTIMGNDLPGDMFGGDTRKLTAVMLLTQPDYDFTGGEFQINEGREEYPTTVSLNKGDMVIFPSFMIHRVKPVLSGVRKSIVIWVEGPKFK